MLDPSAAGASAGGSRPRRGRIQSGNLILFVKLFYNFLLKRFNFGLSNPTDFGTRSSIIEAIIKESWLINVVEYEH